mgnify:CR=1 FL=1
MSPLTRSASSSPDGAPMSTIGFELMDGGVAFVGDEKGSVRRGGES